MEASVEASVFTVILSLKLKSILDQQYPHFGFDKYPTPFNKAAMLWYFLTKNHCFVDINELSDWLEERFVD
ncbi:Doc protein [Desulfosporosinus metallidurans]|uniref:Doc protein n=1 Tax=Desulfosporosinus metallidurans TaxID=1888891 RepID=A0A1Q8QZ79_9FIRM|nr:Doc protein [Desulfosporosinus metallidurans]